MQVNTALNETEMATGRYRVEAVVTTSDEPLVVGHADTHEEIRKIVAWVREAPEVIDVTIFDTLDGRRLTRLG